MSFETACLSHRVALAEDIDELNHVNNAVYVRWIQDAAVGHWSALVSEELPAEYVWMCSRHEVDYRAQIVEGDEVEVRTWLGDAKGARFSRYTDIRKVGADKPAVTATTSWVLLNRSTGKPQRVNIDILEVFGLNF